MSDADPPPRDTPDRVLRRLLTHPDHLRTLLRRAVPHLADRFDYARMRVLDRAFPGDDWRDREADLLFELPYLAAGDERAVLVWVLLEHQSAPDPLIPLRTLVYTVMSWERQWRDWEQLPRPRGRLRLTPVVPVVFHAGGRPWRDGRDLAELFDAPPEVLAWVPAWRPVLWELAGSSADDLIASAEAFAQLLAVVREEGADAGRFGDVLTRAMRSVTPLYGPERVRWYDLLRAMVTWASWRRPPGERAGWLAAAEASQDEAARRGEVRTMGQSFAEAMIEEGLARGRSEGLAEGRREGELAASRATLLRMGRKKFGEPAPVAAVEAITDLDRLGRLPDRLLDVATWDDLLAGA